jgi:thymidylate kinase
VGIFVQKKVASAVTDAQKALQEGKKVFVARFWDEVVAYQGTGAIAGAADFIDACEKLGWRLEHASYSWVPEKRRGVQVLIFRKAK